MSSSEVDAFFPEQIYAPD